MIEVRELHAMGQASDEELWEAIEAAAQARDEAKGVFRDAPVNIHRRPEAAPAWAAAAASTNSETAIQYVLNAAGCVCPRGWKAGIAEEQAAQCVLLRDIFGNPFHSAWFGPEWRTSTAVALASQMYDSRDFGAMPILADALQDAGYDNDDILNHCRGPGPHVRGCWVVDLVLGKS
jgi:hypothetical protein